ncbi:hypothetical protein KP77_23420 [Jeotgalibacillus alimentarius]|uniref:DUF2157 domain-containing protein n=1 Tax=Jeotgalibacillus alimentarius TaxID=135826 RepID=A0A0C2RE76_9BACL|nr:hypothetical protein [Jeotgalibacillus alimentarius]KIL48555.1 hypothetical protein KP77_23420 [Jeotgalibacillus alimentarius]
MDKKRKEVIVNEIQYWKQNRLLPESYCDYLINLYTSGEYEETDETKAVEKPDRKANIFVAGFSLAGSLLTIIALLFGDLALALQAIISILVSAGIMIVSFRPGASPAVKIFSRIAAAFIILLFSIELWRFMYDGDTNMLYLIIGIQCLIWAVAGLSSKQHYFTVSGVLGVIVLIILYI